MIYTFDLNKKVSNLSRFVSKPPCIFIDATTICQEHSGIGVYTQNILDYFSQRTDTTLEVGVRKSAYELLEPYLYKSPYTNSDSDDNLNTDSYSGAKNPQSTVLGITPDFKTTFIPLSERPHVALNSQLFGNRIRSRASAGIFPNYFIPAGWPTPTAATVHDVSFITHPQFYSRKMRLWYINRIRHTVNHASLILTVSEASKKGIIEHLGVSADRVMVHPPTPARPRYSDITSNPHPRPYLIYVGNLEPKKNIENMLLAFEHCGLRNIDLVLVGKFHAGTTSWRRRVQQIIQANPRIHYTGFLSDTLRNTYLVNAAGLIHCTHVEGFGISLLDALQHRIPAIISRDAALQEVAGGHTTVVDEMNISAIAEAMVELIEKTNLGLTSGIINANSGAMQNMESPKEPTGLIEADTASLQFRLDMAQRYALENFGAEAYTNRLDSITDRLLHQQRRLFVVGGQAEHTSQRAVVASMAYAFIFGEIACLDKIYHSLPLRGMSRAEFNRVLGSLLQQLSSIIQRQGPLLHFKGTETNSPSAQNNTVAGTSDFDTSRFTITSPTEMRRDHQRLLRRIGMLPWIKALYYSGGTAHQQPDPKHGDLDLFVVAARNRVWLAWLCIKMLGGSGNRLCANYLVDEDAQEITWQSDFYTAHQLLFLRQVIRKPGVAHIRAMNPIVQHYFPNSPDFKNPRQHQTKTSRWSFFGTLLNACMFAAMSIWWSISQRRSASGGMLWDLHRIKLHTNDHRQRIYKEFNQRLNHFNTVLAGVRSVTPARSKSSVRI
jgi:glycosyltransferase involved in cell wall biosynthesis